MQKWLYAGKTGTKEGGDEENFDDGVFSIEKSHRAELALLLPLSCPFEQRSARFRRMLCDVSVFPVRFLLVMCFDDLTTISTVCDSFIPAETSSVLSSFVCYFNFDWCNISGVSNAQSHISTFRNSWFTSGKWRRNGKSGKHWQYNPQLQRQLYTSLTFLQNPGLGPPSIGATT